MKIKFIPLLPLGLLTVIAWVVRAWNANSLQFQTNEAFAWRIASYPWRELFQRVALDTTPAAHYVLLKVWMGLFGESPLAIRGLSVACGAACVPLVYVLCRDALRAWPSASGDASRYHAAALVAAALVAVHPLQRESGATARMYSLAAMFAAASSWAAIRALQADRRHRLRWWVAYAVLGASLLHTHHFGWFCVLAQGLFLAGLMIMKIRRTPWAELRHEVGCAAYAGLFMAALFAPWAHAFYRQSTRVQAGFHIRPTDANDLSAFLEQWLVGTRTTNLAFQGVLVAVVATVGWQLIRRDRAMLFFGLQAATPWACMLAIEWFARRPLFAERYLTMAHIAWACCCGLAYHRISAAPLRHALGAALVSLSLLTTLNRVALLGNSAPPLVRAVNSVAQRYVDDRDLVIVADASALNVARYYLRRAGILDAHVRCGFHESNADGQQTYVASLAPEDILVEIDWLPARVQRLWRLLGGGMSALETTQGFRRTDERHFDGFTAGQRESYVLREFVRQPP